MRTKMTLEQRRDGEGGAVQRISSWPVSCLRQRPGTGRGRACSGRRRPPASPPPPAMDVSIRQRGVIHSVFFFFFFFGREQMPLTSFFTSASSLSQSIFDFDDGYVGLSETEAPTENRRGREVSLPGPLAK